MNLIYSIRHINGYKKVTPRGVEQTLKTREKTASEPLAVSPAVSLMLETAPDTAELLEIWRSLNE